MKRTLGVLAALAALSLVACTSGSGLTEAITSVPTPAVSVSPSPSPSITMPPLMGLTEDKARSALASNPVEVQVTVSVEFNDGTYTEGEVVGQQPDSGAALIEGQTVLLYVAGPAPSPESVAAKVAQDFIDGYVFGSVSTRYALVGNGHGDGYAMEAGPARTVAQWLDPNRGHVPFKRALLIDAMSLPNHPNSWGLLQDAVLGNRDLLEKWDFDYVMIAFSLKTNSDKDVIAMGYSLKDWPKWGTGRQPEYETMGLVTSMKGVEVVSVSNS